MKPYGPFVPPLQKVGMLAMTMVVSACLVKGSSHGASEGQGQNAFQDHPALNAEDPPSAQVGEMEKVVAISRQINEIQRMKAAQNGGLDRGFHAKSHICVEARLRVLAERPEETRHGIFAEERSYPAWIRFSNAQSAKQSDAVPDIRGFALKVMGVEGPKLMRDQEDAKTQDFLAINQPVLFVKDGLEFMNFQMALARGGISLASYMLTHPRVAVRLIAHLRSVKSVLLEPYWSTVPSLLGPRAIKFRFFPCSNQNPSTPQQPQGDNPLHSEAVERLQKESVCYDLAVQFQRDAVKQPVEDATVEWKESDTPFVRVAQVTIAQMNLNQEESKNKTDFCNQLNWNPWHSLKAHRPLGSINRLRMLSMRESQKYRGWSTLPKEPDGSEFQGSDTPK